MEDLKVSINPQIKAVVSHYQAIKDKGISDLEVLLNRPVGMSSNSNITDEIILKLETVQKADSMLNFMSSIIIPQQQQEEI
jgi:hypothetical protein